MLLRESNAVCLACTAKRKEPCLCMKLPACTQWSPLGGSAALSSEKLSLSHNNSEGDSVKNKQRAQKLEEQGEEGEEGGGGHQPVSLLSIPCKKYHSHSFL